MVKRLTLEEFIEKAKKVHPLPESFDYSRVNYKKAKEKVEIGCNVCGNWFLQSPDKHINRKHGCPYCKHHIKLTVEEFVKKGNIRHSGKCSYLDVKEIINVDTKVKIHCTVCDKDFWQTPYHHLRDNGCPYCGSKNAAEKQKLTKEEFFNKLTSQQKEEYDYDLDSYVSYHRKMRIYCKHCKEWFLQSPSKHLIGQGCPRCSSSNGEKITQQWLKENNIRFKQQKTFKDCKDHQSLRFDFYLLDHNLCIEFQGVQHYKPEFFVSVYKSEKTGLEKYNLQLKHDKMKKEYCRKNKIDLLEIRYDDNIEKKLEEKIRELEDKKQS